MLLCIYTIVAVVAMMVCGFRPDFTIQSVTQRKGKMRKKKIKENLLNVQLNSFLSKIIGTCILYMF